jgi:hypothetical protein
MANDSDSPTQHRADGAEIERDDAVPPSVRGWFVLDFVFSALVIGLPLLLVPELLLPRLGWNAVDPVATRLVGAALVAIGWQSWRSRESGQEAYRALLGLKVIWCSLGILGLVAAIGAGAPQASWALLAVLLLLDGVWIHYAIRIKKFQAAFGAGSDLTDAARRLEDDRGGDGDGDATAEDRVPAFARAGARDASDNQDPDEDAATEDLGPLPMKGRPREGRRGNGPATAAGSFTGQPPSDPSA